LRDQLSKKLTGAVLFSGLCLSSFAQTNPIETPKSTDYPGILETFEKLIQIDNTRFRKKTDLLSTTGKTLSDASTVTNLDLEPDFLNSLILHSDPGYLKLAGQSKCRFYDALITDLLRTSEGRVKNIIVTYVTTKGSRETSVLSKKDFLQKVVSVECPESMKMISAMSLKNLDATVKEVNFDLPTGEEQCHSIHLGWLSNPKTPYLCQIHEYISEANANAGEQSDLAQRKALARVLEKKINPTNREYLANICSHLDEEKLFCQDFLYVSFWNKIANGQTNRIYAEEICRKALKTQTLSEPQLRECLARMKKESDICLYPANPTALVPQMECDLLSTALNYSSFRSDFNDAPSTSDQLGITNMGRIILNANKTPIRPFEGPPSVISAAETFIFNENFDNDDKWKLEACYDNKITNAEVCTQIVIGKYLGLRQSYTSVVEEILKRTRGADPKVSCSMVSETEFNPLLLKFKSGCHIVYDAKNCQISRCPHKIIYNDRPITFIRLKSELSLDYFPLNIPSERTSQHYLLSNDFKRNARNLSNLSSINAFFKKTKKGVIHGIGCAEELLPSFFKVRNMNQCSPLPFIIDGIIRKDDKTVMVTRTAIDSLQAPRLISWSNIFSGVKSYQLLHPMRLWTMYGLD
jgi:hypothetical protein